jgi:hypothetical protein
MSELEAFSIIILIIALIPTLACLTVGVFLLYAISASPIIFIFDKIHKTTKVPKKLIYILLGIPFFYYSYGLFINTFIFLIKLFGNFISNLF